MPQKSLVWHLSDQKIFGKVLMALFFALKCHECDSRLPCRVLILFLCLHLCVPSVLQGPQGAHTFSLIGRCVVMPATMLT